jgi:hypothetical protein
MRSIAALTGGHHPCRLPGWLAHRQAITWNRAVDGRSHCVYPIAPPTRKTGCCDHQMTKLWDIYEVGSGFAVEDRFTAKRHSYHRTLEGAEKALGRLQAKGAVVVTHPAPKSKSKSKSKPKRWFRFGEILQKRMPKRHTELTRREEDEANGQWRYRRRTMIVRPRWMVSGGLPGLGKRR